MSLSLEEVKKAANPQLATAIAYARRVEDIPPEIRDSVIDWSGGGVIAGALAQKIERWDMEGICQVKNPVVLALGAGNADAEGKLAQHLKAHRLIIVDRNKPEDVHPQLPMPAELHYGQGMVHYLQELVEHGELSAIDLATIIGVEYVLAVPEFQEALAFLLAKVIKPRGLLVVWPFNDLRMDIWQKYGWQIREEGAKLVVFIHV